MLSPVEAFPGFFSRIMKNSPLIFTSEMLDKTTARNFIAPRRDRNKIRNPNIESDPADRNELRDK